MGTINEKLEYLNTTKSKIKDSINLTGSNITDETFREYSSKLQDGLLYIFNNGVDVIWNNWDKVTGSGTAITLNNTLEAKMKIVLKGNTYQYSTSGKNLFSDVISDYSVNSYRLRNLGTGNDTLTISFIDKDTSIDVAGINMGFSITTDPNTSGYVWSLSNGVVTQNKTNITTNGHQIGEKAPYIMIYPNDATTFNKIIQRYYIQVEKGTTPTSYEPYTGGIPAPNPDFPEPIHVVSGDNSIEVKGKNFANVINVNGNLSKSEDIITLASGSTGSNFIDFEEKTLEANVEYKLEMFLVGTTTNNVASELVFRDSNNNVIFDSSAILNGNVSKTFTPTNAITIYRLNIYNSSNPSSSTPPTTGEVKFKIQIRKSSATSGYEPYQSQTYPINLPEGMELCKIGTYQDKIDKSTGQQMLDLSVGFTNSYINSAGTVMSGVANALFNGYIDVKPNTYYTFSCNKSIRNLSISEFNGSTFIQRNQADTTSYNTIITTSTTNKIRISVNYDNSTTVTQTIVDSLNLMLNEGQTALPYEPYGTSWYLKKEIGKVVLNGTENWQLYTGTCYYISATNSKVGYQTSLCSHFKNINAAFDSGIAGRYCDHPTLTTKYFVSSSPTIADFKTWLSNNNVKLYYILATPTFTPITGTLANQLTALENARSYLYQTNLSQVNDDLPFILDVNALKEIAATTPLTSLSMSRALPVSNNASSIELNEEEVEVNIEPIEENEENTIEEENISETEEVNER